MGDVRPAAVQLLDLPAVDVEPQDAESAVRERQRERQAHVAEADDSHPGFLRLDRAFQSIRMLHHGTPPIRVRFDVRFIAGF